MSAARSSSVMLSCVMSSSTEDGVGLYRTSQITYRLQTPDTPPVGLYVASPVGYVSQMCEVLGGTSGGTLLRGGCGRTPQRRAEFEAEALPRSLPSGSQSCLICVDRTHFGRDRPGRLGRLVGPSGGICCVVTHGGEHDVGESPLQAAQGFSFRLAGSVFAFVVDAAFG